MVSGQNTAEGIAIGTAPTTGNSGGASGTACSTVSQGTASTILVTAAALIHGTRGFEFTLAGSTSDGATRLVWAMAETGRLVFSFYVNVPVAITAVEDLGGIRNATGNMMVLSVGADGKLIVNDSSGVAIAASKAPNVFPTGIVRVDISCAPGTTSGNGTIGYAYYLNNSTTAVYSWESTAVNSGTTAIAQGYIGRSTGRAVARTLSFDTVRWATTASGFMAPYVDTGGTSGGITQIGVNTAEGIPVNTQLTAASPSITGGASGTAASSIAVGAGSTIIVSNFNVAHGSRGYAFNLAGSASDGATRILFPAVRADRLVFSFYVGELSALPGATEDLGGVRNSTGNIAILSIGADGKLILNDAGGSISASRASATFPVQQRVRIDISVAKGTATNNGLIGYSYYLGDSDTPVFVYEANNRNTGTTDTASVFIGRSTGRVNPTLVYIDTIRWGFGASGWFGHYVAPKTAPYGDLGGDINDIEPFSTVTINTGLSFDIDGTITAYALSQISGPSVGAITGSGPIFTYKAPGDLVAITVGWQLIVTDNDGMKSAAVSSAHNILPVNEMAAVGGVWVPMEMFLMSSSSPAGNSSLNPSVATLGGWSNHMGGTTLTLDSTSPISAPTSAMVTKDSASGSLAFLRIPGGYLTPTDDNDMTSPEFKAVTPIVGKVMAWSLDIKCDVDAQADVGVFTLDAAGNQIDGVEEIHVFPANVVTRIGCTFLVPSGSVGAWLDIIIDPQASTVVGTRTRFDNLLIELDSGRTYIPADVNGYHPAGVYDLDYYVDGDTPGYHWAGTPGASATVKDA